MDKLIQKVVEKAGIDTNQAEQAIGTVFALLRDQASAQDGQEIMDALPGAQKLAEQYGTAKKGVLAMLGGTVMGTFAKLTALGLSVEQIEIMGKEVLAHAEEKLGKEKVDEIIASIPGLDKLV